MILSLQGRGTPPKRTIYTKRQPVETYRLHNKNVYAKTIIIIIFNKQFFHHKGATFHQNAQFRQKRQPAETYRPHNKMCMQEQ